jgi:CheY-like chemotaxis protein
MMPAFPAPPAPEPSAPDGGRRGKPKRRRFNFNVLENLEKMVQPKPSEPVPTSGWTPPAAPPAGAVAPPAASFPVGLQPPTASGAPSAPAAPTTPTAEPASGAQRAGPEPAAFQLQFTPQAEATTSGAAEQPAVDVTAPATEEADEYAAASAPESAASVSEPEATPEAESTKTDARRSMRSMMFGEEVAAPETEAATLAEPEVAPEQEQSSTADVEASAPAVEPTWPSYSWNRRDEASSSTEEVSVPETSASGFGTEEAHEAEPVGASSTSSDGFDPWATSYAAEAETTTEPDSSSAAALPGAEVSEAERVQAPDQPVAADDGNATAGTLVIIEDDPTAASYYATLFRGNGYRVEVANDGVSGVDLATRMQPQVILLDVMMPRQNGILVLQTLRASDETKNTPVVVMSNFSEPTLIKRALQLGALEYVIKTQVEGPALLTALPRWMNREKAFAAA